MFTFEYIWFLVLYLMNFCFLCSIPQYVYPSAYMTTATAPSVLTTAALQQSPLSPTPGQYIDYTAAYGSQLATAAGLEATYPYANVSTAGLVAATSPYSYMPQQIAAASGAAFYQPPQLQERMQWRQPSISDIELMQTLVYKENPQ